MEESLNELFTQKFIKNEKINELTNKIDNMANEHLCEKLTILSLIKKLTEKVILLENKFRTEKLFSKR